MSHRSRRLLLISGLAFLVAACGYATHVRGYTRKDGTYVAPHERRASTHAGSHSYAGSSSYSGYSHARRTRTSLSSGYTDYTSHYATGYVGARDEHGRIVRSEAAKREFMRTSGYPHGRPGYVVDHIIALKHGGADEPSNMQWQTIADAKAKDKWE